MIHPVPRFGIEQIVDDHRVVEPATYIEAGMAQYHQIELDVLSDFGDRLVLEYRPERVDDPFCVVGPTRDVPRFVRNDGDRYADKPVVEDVESGRFGIEAELRDTFQLSAQSFEVGQRLDRSIGMGESLDRVEHGCAEECPLLSGRLCACFERGEEVRSGLLLSRGLFGVRGEQIGSRTARSDSGIFGALLLQLPDK